MTMDQLYGNNKYWSEFNSYALSNNAQTNDYNQQDKNCSTHPDPSYLPFTVNERSGNLDIQQLHGQQQYSFSNNFEYYQTDAFSQYGQCYNGAFNLFDEKQLETERFQLKRKRNRIASNKCR